MYKFCLKSWKKDVVEEEVEEKQVIPLLLGDQWVRPFTSLRTEKENRRYRLLSGQSYKEFNLEGN